MTWVFDAFNYRQPVPIVEATPGETFVIGSGDAPGPHGHPYMLEITITKAEGDTVVRLVNSGFSEDSKFDDEYEGVVSGWKGALGTLKRWLERYPDATRTHLIVMEPASYAREALRPLYATIEGRRRWLAPLLPEAAEVLVDTGSEVLLAWDARNAVLGLKAFRMGAQQMLALDLSSWRETPLTPAVEGELRAALQRLKEMVAER